MSYNRLVPKFRSDVILPSIRRVILKLRNEEILLQGVKIHTFHASFRRFWKTLCFHPLGYYVVSATKLAIVLGSCYLLSCKISCSKTTSNSTEEQGVTQLIFYLQRCTGRKSDTNKQKGWESNISCVIFIATGVVMEVFRQKDVLRNTRHLYQLREMKPLAVIVLSSNCISGHAYG